MHIEGVLQLLAQRLHLGALLQELLAEAVHLPLEHVDVCHRRLEQVQLAFEVCQLDLEDTDLVQAVAVLHLSLGQCTLLDLDLFV